MEEGSSKAIPLRRQRAAGTRVVAPSGRGWVERLNSGIRTVVLEPPRQLWLASLGGTAITLRGARDAWLRTVAIGAEIETRLLGSWRNVRRAG